MSKVGSRNPCPTLGQLLASRDFVHALGRRKAVRNCQGKILYTKCSKLANSWSTPRQLPTSWEVAEVFLAVVLWQHPKRKTFLPRQKDQSQRCILRKRRNSGAEIQTSGADTRTAVWASTAENFFKIVLGETRMFRVVSAPALYKNPAIILTLQMFLLARHA